MPFVGIGDAVIGIIPCRTTAIRGSCCGCGLGASRSNSNEARFWPRTTQMDAMLRAPVDHGFFSRSQNGSANKHSVTSRWLQEANEHALSVGAGTAGNNVGKTSNGQAFALSPTRIEGVYPRLGGARHTPWRGTSTAAVNTVRRFIGPEYLYTETYMRAGLERIISVGQLMGLPMGL